MASGEFHGTRSAILAGTWYPGPASQLRTTIEDYLAKAPLAEDLGEIIGLIAPHAGYYYSGQVAAHAYRQVMGRTFDTVVVISPTHRGLVANTPAMMTAARTYSTPIGDISLQSDMAVALSHKVPITMLRRDEEHSLEIQLPFLQVTLPSFELLPVMMADQSLPFCRQLGKAVAEVLSAQAGRALIVASTDLSHFYPYETALALDRVAQAYIDAYDIEGFAGALTQRKTEACGGGPVMAAMVAARELGANHARILHYANSGDVTGDHSRVVGYAAGVLSQL